MGEEQSIPVLSQREQSKANRRAAIIDFAKHSFLEKGFENTSMSAIAQQMGGSKGTLWTYFPSKEDLFNAVLESMSATFQSFTAMALNSEEHVEIVLKRFCEIFIARISSPEAIALQRLVISQAERFPELPRIFFERGPRINHSMISNYIGRQMLAGKLRQDDPEEAGSMILDLCTAGYHDLVLWNLHLQDKTIEERNAERVVKQFMRCYAPDQSAW